MKTKYNITIRSLTKDDLIRSGIKKITHDCKVIFEDGRVLEKEEDFLRNEQGYLYFLVEETDPVTIIQKQLKGVQNNKRTIYLHRAVYAWFKGGVPKDLCVDHINNKHTTLYDNRLDNLQLLTDEANLKKDAQYKCSLNRPLEDYERMLKLYIDKLNTETDKERKKLYQEYVERYQAKIRFWKAHKEI